MGEPRTFDADCWYATRWGWCAQLSLPWTEPELRGFRPDQIRVDGIDYHVSDIQISYDADRVVLMVFVQSDLDVVPTEPFVKAPRGGPRVD